MSRIILAFEVSGESRQIHVDEGYTFDRSGFCAAYLRDGSGTEVEVSLVGEQPFRMVKSHQNEYVEGFRSISNLAACSAAVPRGSTVVVIDGKMGENATIFFEGGGISAVRDNGRNRLADLQTQTGLQIGDGNSMTLDLRRPRRR